MKRARRTFLVVDEKGGRGDGGATPKRARSTTVAELATLQRADGVRYEMNRDARKFLADCIINAATKMVRYAMDETTLRASRRLEANNSASSLATGTAASGSRASEGTKSYKQWFAYEDRALYCAVAAQGGGERRLDWVEIARAVVRSIPETLTARRGARSEEVCAERWRLYFAPHQSARDLVWGLDRLVRANPEVDARLVRELQREIDVEERIQLVARHASSPLEAESEQAQASLLRSMLRSTLREPPSTTLRHTPPDRIHARS